jgi:fructosamine-3-kinase
MATAVWPICNLGHASPTARTVRAVEEFAALPSGVGIVLTELGFGSVTIKELLAGGNHGRALRLGSSSGATVVVKTGSFEHPDVYRCEADALRALRVPGGPRTPEVLGCGDDFLVLEDMAAAVPADGAFWETFGRQVAALHSVHGPAFGYDTDNYLGTLPQRNPWTDDGWTFFAEQRLLRYLDEPSCLAALEPQDRAGIERICARLPELVPAQPPGFLHGDLWRMNVLAAGDGAPVMIDPAPYYAWPEIDLSMLACCSRIAPAYAIPPRFFDAYQEARPCAEGLEDRFDLLILRELLSGVAHYGTDAGCLEWIREIVRRFG